MAEKKREDDYRQEIARKTQENIRKQQDTLPADIDQPFYDSMDSLIEKLSNMNIMGYETMARGSFSSGVNSAGVAMPKMKVTLEDLLGNSPPLTDYLRVEYNQMKQQIGDVSFEDYKNMAFADNSFDYYSRNEEIRDLAVTLVINGAVLVIGGTLPWPLMVALGLTSGGKNISDAWRGKDLFTGKKLSTGDRILRGLSGVADVALAGYGTYKGIKPRPGTTKVVVSDKGSGSNNFKFGSNSKNHLKNAEAVNTKKGVVGGHNMEEFNNALKNQGFNPEDLIVSKKTHPTIDGIYEVEYKIPRKDMTGNVAEPVSYKNIEKPKTVYDPTKISDGQMFEWGQSAMNNGKIQPDGRTIIGTSQNGIKFIGYLNDAGEVTNFFPVLN